MLRFFGFGTEEKTAADAYPEKDTMAAESEAAEPHILYLNLVMLNNDEVIEHTVEGKLPKRAGPLMRRAAKKVARAKISDESLGLRIGSTLAERLPEQLGTMGVELDATVRYAAGTLLVVEIALKSVDGMKLLDAQASENAEMVHAAVNAASYVGLGDTVQSQLNKKVMATLEERLQTTLPEMLCAKLQEKGLQAHAYLRPAATQAALFFELLDNVGAPGCIVDDEKGTTVH